MRFEKPCIIFSIHSLKVSIYPYFRFGMSILVLPGDEVPATWISTKGTSNKKLKTVGPGLKVHTDRTLIATVAGILHETDAKIWVESAETR